MQSTIFSDSEKVIYEYVKFENVLINYDLSKDFEVEFSLDKAVKGSSRDWIGIFNAGWNSYESFLAHESALSLPCDESGRRRKVKFNIKYLQDAKAGIPYQFVYVNKYLEILGVSQYFQFIVNNLNGSKLPNDTICEGSFTPNMGSSPLKNQDVKNPWNEDHTIEEDEIMRVSSTSPSLGHFHTNCKLYSISKWKNSCTSCYQCRSIFQLKESHDDLLEKIKLYQDHNFSLRNRVDRLEKLLQWEDKEKELNAYMLHLSEVVDNAIRSSVYEQAENKGATHSYFDWDFSSKELFLKAIIGQQEVTIRDLNKVICELGYIDKPRLSYCPSTSLQDIVKTKKAEERVVAEVYDINNNTSEEEF
ncbi:calcium-binding and coiled-coil domain-containing protein 2 isoform X2 [Halyomorpha halys]|uniref:calcium-binding and coiled-coil domain-containing protein 2 isoform X2 n=1 Tax=Halyomorpha halys TaxID=286706 RepID=UPI0006D52257|nr:uncharacterized protein LOC106688609 isoform X2 [Halyomorpha halys]